MTLSLEISEELQADLVREAQVVGMPLQDYALHLLASRHAPDPMPQNGAELVSYWRNAGVIGCRPDIVDPVAYSQDLRRQSESR